jgi:transposase-like protein
MRRQYTSEQRERLVAEVRSTGEPVRVVAERLGVTVSSAYLWMKDATVGPSKPVFARVVPAGAVSSSSLTLEVGRARVLVEVGFDAELLRQVIAALSAGS